VSEGPAKPRRLPKQARSKQIVDAIQTACERILREEGPDALNTNRIAEVAGVTVGSLYRYFPNKEAVVSDVYEQMLRAQSEAYEALYARADELRGLGLEELVRLTVDANADLHVRLLALHPEFYRRHLRQLDLGDRQSERFDRSWIAQTERWLRGVLARHREALSVEDLDLAAFVALRAIAGVLRAAARDTPERLSEPAFRDALHRMVLGYLRADPTA